MLKPVKPHEPAKPDPLAFGLTPIRLRELESPTTRLLPHRKPLRTSSNTTLGASVPTKTRIGAKTAILSLLRMALFLWLIGLMFSVPILILLHPLYFLMVLGTVLMLYFLVHHLMSYRHAVWLRSQPDFDKFERYQREVEQYGKSLLAYERELAEYVKQLAAWHRTQEQWWSSLSGSQFEIELGTLLERRGYTVRHTAGPGDGGVDLVLTGKEGVILVQCKAHMKPVGPGPVRELYGTLTHRGGEEAWLVSTSEFTTGARGFARGKRIRLITIGELLQEDH